MAGAEAKRANGEPEIQGVSDNNCARPAEPTPGPWRVVGEGNKATVLGYDSTIVAVRHRLPPQVHEANARLIAAAPKMLTALELIASLTEGQVHDIARIAAQNAKE